MNKFITVLTVLIIAINGFSQNTGEIKWYTFEEALELNAQNPKLIFIDVYTEWCGWCKKMDAATFKEPYIAKYMNDKYYCVKLDAEGKEPINYMGKEYTNPNPDGRRSTHQIAALLLQNKMSYPSYVFMNEQSKVLTVVKGFITDDKFDPIIHWFGERAFLTQKFPDYSATFKSVKEKEIEN